jgi:hypothetical protein
LIVARVQEATALLFFVLLRGKMVLAAASRKVLESMASILIRGIVRHDE